MVAQTTRRTFISSISLSVVGLLTGSILGGTSNRVSGETTTTQKPNIILILSDDQGWADVSYHGAEFETPNIDRIANEGIKLERFYVCPVCSPTRAGLLTGRYPLRFGLQRTTVKPWDTRGLPTEEITIAEMLSFAGYKQRALLGKWHLGNTSRKFHPLSQGFTHFYGHFSGHIDYFKHTKMKKHNWHRQYEPNYDKGYSTHLLGNEAVRFIEDNTDQQPFFLYLPFNAIHTPNHYPQRYYDRLSHITDERRRQRGAMITAMDDNIGHLLDTLDTKGIADNTIVLFISDNGGPIKAGSVNKPLRGEKHEVFEGGIRVPAAIRWPRVLKGGRTIDVPMSYIDVFPTLQRIVEASYPDGNELDGEDVFDIITGKQKTRDWEFYSYLGSSPEKVAVNTNEWKLIRIGPQLLTADDPYAGAELYLFRIDKDPYETTNSAEQHPDIVENLLNKMKKFRKLEPAHFEKTYIVKAPEGWELDTWEVPDG